MTEKVRFAFGRFLLLPAQRLLLRDGEAVAVGSRAFDLLVVLAEEAGTVVSKETLLARVWSHVVVDEGSLRVHMTALRKALREEETGERHIANVPRRGYSLVTLVTRSTSPPDSAPASRFTADFPPPMLALNAPLAPAPLIGREDAIRNVADGLMRRGFLTVTGPGGIGKTSVAVAAATRLKAQEGMHACFVDLGALGVGEVVDAAIAAAMGMPVSQLGAYAGPRTVLILDNCEHVIDAAAAFAERTAVHAPSMLVLATSREPLRARREGVQRLQPLTSPPLMRSLHYSEALRYAAFELFVERAGATQMHYRDDDVALIAQLCHRLDGNPLAIELAASQAGFFGLAGLLAQIASAGDIPVAGWRTAQPRHHSMTESLRWSFQLLTPGERHLFKRLSAFSEPFLLDAAVEVASEDGSAAATETLMGLVRKSLVWADACGPAMHYRMDETTRAFAAAQSA